MNFTNKDIMDLRAKTGVGMMDCKKALIEADGDMDKAVDILREKGMATSAKRAGKIASQGIVDAYGKDGVYALVEVNCESDFVAKGDQFKAFVREIAEYIVDAAPASVEDVAAAKADLLNETVAKIGEKIVVRRFERYVAADGAAVSSYIHMGGKIGVMVETVGASDDVAHDVALQIAAANPDYVTIAEVPADRVEKEKEILKVQALNEDKPKPMNIIEKMIEGRIHKFYKEVCLLEQPFVKDQDKSVGAYLKANGGAKVNRFVRFTMGEGLEKKEENLANEVEEQIAKAKAGK